MSVAATQSLPLLLRALKLPSFVEHHDRLAQQAEHQGASYVEFLHNLVELELSDRERRKIERIKKRANLPSEKTLATLETKRLPIKVRRQLPTLCTGDFVDRAENVLAFGLPGRGKTHTVCAIGHELVQRGYKIYFTPAFRLVQRLLIAKRELLLEKQLRQLDSFDVVIIDDLGYIQQNREEMEVLFTFLSERYERRSLMITSNLVFSQWDKIFKDPMTTAAAIDRIVHHSRILEITGKSYRGEEARKNNSSIDSENTGSKTNEESI